MQLLIQRGQRDSMMSPVFHLWAKFELKEEELALLNKYKMNNAIITEGNTKRRHAAPPSSKRSLLEAGI